MEYQYNETLGFETPVWTDDELDEMFDECEDIRDDFQAEASDALVNADYLTSIEMTTDNQEMSIAAIDVDGEEHQYWLNYALDGNLPAGFRVFNSDKGTLVEGVSLETAVEQLEEVLN